MTEDKRIKFKCRKCRRNVKEWSYNKFCKKCRADNETGDQSVKRRRFRV